MNYPINKVSAYLWTLPRWFAAPAAVASVTLGGVLTGQSPGVIALASLAGALMMAYAHSWNSFQDWVSGFDQGTATERSHEKPYTGGQNLIAKGLVDPTEVFTVAMVYLALSFLVTWFLAAQTSQWVWLAWSLVASCAPLYSWGKRTYTCELWLALGFGPLAVTFGAAVGPSPEMARAFLAGIPFGLVFGYMAELVDQYLDADVNVPKGLRNLGAWCWNQKFQLGLTIPLLLMAVIVSVVHIALAVAGIFHPLTLFAIPAVFVTAVLGRRYELTPSTIMVGLGMVLLYPLIIVLVEVLA